LTFNIIQIIFVVVRTTTFYKSKLKQK